MNLDEDDEIPIFTKQTVNFKPTDKVTHLSVNNETILLTMSNNVLLRINLSKPSSSSADGKHSSDGSKGQPNNIIDGMY